MVGVVGCGGEVCPCWARTGRIIALRHAARMRSPLVRRSVPIAIPNARLVSRREVKLPEPGVVAEAVGVWAEEQRVARKCVPHRVSRPSAASDGVFPAGEVRSRGVDASPEVSTEEMSGGESARSGTPVSLSVLSRDCIDE